MAEKRGGTEKIQFDFNTAAVLEVCMDDSWFRVTAKDFRSFDGERRITNPTSTRVGITDLGDTTEDYFGPVYLFATNIQVGKIADSKFVRDLSRHQKL